MSLSGRITEWINRVEVWIADRPRPLILSPLRLAASILLFGLLMVANLAALAHWPFSAVFRVIHAVRAGGEPAPGVALHVDQEMLESLLQQDLPVLVDFWAEWWGLACC